jgi:hypothetical protein
MPWKHPQVLGGLEIDYQLELDWQTGNKKLQDIYVAVILDNPRLHSAVLSNNPNKALSYKLPTTRRTRELDQTVFGFYSHGSKSRIRP